MGIDVYKAKENLHRTQIPFSMNMSEIRDMPINSENETGQILDTPSNITVNERQFRRFALRLESILREQKDKENKLDPEIDHIETITRRFNALQEKTKGTRRSFQGLNQPQVNASRRFSGEYPWHFLHDQKPRAYALMETFLYICRSKLPFTQVLRNKYLDTRKYKIGYIFANIRTIMEQMQWLYNAMVRSFDNFAVFVTYIHFLQLYESMIRYQLDVRDLIDYLTRLEYDRKLIYDPEYYDERPWKPFDTEP
ncbi:unnamed protein product [Arctia plantaginis]|uniref:Uncharacterized protein n=1 Tax=Arctia plantaginis TaxID=874455 RepID=A0A8S0YMB8_ARCPL|nr:unnamed protein product [Arctia plantaginis]CAB3259503.1 unnamed protein product [Arctia plantaginis]